MPFEKGQGGPGRSEYPTKKLFKQFNPEGKECLDTWRKTFVDCLDPTEYRGALALVGSWAEWNKFKSYWPQFRNEILPEWLEEVEIRLRSEAVMHICVQAQEKGGTAAAKFLAEGKYTASKRGRPSKAEVERQARIEAGLTKEISSDVERVLRLKK